MARKRMTDEQIVNHLNAPPRKARKMGLQRVFGCELSPQADGTVLVLKGGVVVGSASDTYAAQMVAREHW